MSDFEVSGEFSLCIVLPVLEVIADLTVPMP